MRNFNKDTSCEFSQLSSLSLPRCRLCPPAAKKQQRGAAHVLSRSCPIPARPSGANPMLEKAEERQMEPKKWPGTSCIRSCSIVLIFDIGKIRLRHRMIRLRPTLPPRPYVDRPLVDRRPAPKRQKRLREVKSRCPTRLYIHPLLIYLNYRKSSIACLKEDEVADSKGAPAI